MNRKLKLISGIVAAALFTLGSTGAIAASNSHYDTSYLFTKWSGCPQGDIVAGNRADDEGTGAQTRTLAEARALVSFVRSSDAEAVFWTDSEQLPLADFLDHVHYQPPQLQGIKIDLDARDVQRHGSASTKIVKRATSLAVNNLEDSEGQGVMKVEGTEAQRAWILERVQEKLACGEFVQITEHDAERPSLTIRRPERASGDWTWSDSYRASSTSNPSRIHDGVGSIVGNETVVHFGDLAGAQ